MSRASYLSSGRCARMAAPDLSETSCSRDGPPRSTPTVMCMRPVYQGLGAQIPRPGAAMAGEREAMGFRVCEDGVRFRDAGAKRPDDLARAMALILHDGHD